MIESVFVVILICLVFLAAFQYAHLFACKAVLTHAAARAARARAVGFNEWMVQKSARVAAIPASGRRLTPPSTGLDPAILAALRQNRVGDVWDTALDATAMPGRSPDALLEVARIPDYMDSINDPTADELLDYELWDRLDVEIDEQPNLLGSDATTLTVQVRQRNPLLLALEPLADGELRDAAGEEFSIAGFFTIENNYPLYMEDMNW
jgi:hypothetical protein